MATTMVVDDGDDDSDVDGNCATGNNVVDDGDCATGDDDG
jgi:hypothetical protein